MSTPPDGTRDPGLRERKKAQTRAAISDVATRLFIERGFDAVTVADVADAAGVSIKTVFNYFGSKEELFLDRDGAMRDLVVATVARRPAGTTPTVALGAILHDNGIIDIPGWDVLDDPERYAAYRSFLTAWEATPSLVARLLVGKERLAESLRTALSDESPPEVAGTALRAFAAMLVSAVHLRQRTIASGVVAGHPGPEVRDAARAVAAEVLSRAAVAFPDLDLPAD